MEQLPQPTEVLGLLRQRHRADTEDLRQRFQTLAASFEQLGRDITAIANRSQELYVLERALLAGPRETLPYASPRDGA